MNIQVRLTALVFPICLVLVGCAPIIDALVGERVEVDRNDSTRPAVRISIGRAYLVDRSRRTGPFEVTGIDRAAAVYDPLVISAIGDDPEGVQFVELLDISIEPTCFYITPTPTGTTGVSAVAATVTVPGIRTEIPLSSTVATNRMFATKTLVLSKHWCPSTHPGIASAVARVRARAGNFGELEARSATAILSIEHYIPPQRIHPRPGGGSCGGYTPCRNGDRCVPC